MLSGLNIDTFQEVKKLTNKPITIGGGVKDISDIELSQKIEEWDDNIDQPIKTKEEEIIENIWPIPKTPHVDLNRIKPSVRSEDFGGKMVSTPEIYFST